MDGRGGGCIIRVASGGREFAERRGLEHLVMPTTNMDSTEITALCLIPLFAGGMYRVYAWIHYRKINRDAPLTAHQRELTKFLTWFVIGMGYAMVFTAVFSWPKPIWLLLTLFWGLILWTVYRKKRAERRKGLPNEPLG